ncbi:hypothetical protein N9889_02205 [bacterium]|nr:hypothetical protein [bacterium]MDB4290475.1 hypothetical protein [bacterium]MDB4382296.1 hypothetical protein [Akkermansiaceae bacterium]MDB4630798.1 hypothetical protein [Akkermansiaceae bacterium]MDC1404049.1 hypothetical protein [Akkermansiaceae bacterium]
MKLRPHPLIILILAGLTFFLFFKCTPKTPDGSQKATSPNSQSSSSSSSPSSSEIDTSNTDPRFTRFLDGRVHWQASFTTSRQLHQSPDPSADLHLIEQLLSQYRLVYQENPVGTDNAEIIAQLLGGNPKNVFFLDPNLSALNEHGELLDRWGSPFVFHSLKADLMDIRSPGPDRELWTKDDLSLGYEDAEAELRLNR